MSKRVLHLLSLALGLVGLLGCLAAVVGFWILNARLVRAAENVCSAIDHSLIAVQEQADEARDQVQSLKITRGDIEQGVKERTKTELGERLISQAGIQEKAERLANSLQQMDHGLEVTESSVQILQQTVDVAVSWGVSLQPDLVDRLLDELQTLRTRLTEARPRPGSQREILQDLCLGDWLDSGRGSGLHRIHGRQTIIDFVDFNSSCLRCGATRTGANPSA